MCYKTLILIFFASWLNLSHQDILDYIWPKKAETVIERVIITPFIANATLNYKNSDLLDYIEFEVNDVIRETFYKSNLPSFYEINNLLPCTDYKLLIKTHYNKKITETGQLFKTTPVKISSVRNIEYNDDTGLVKWMRPSYGTHCVMGYAIHYGTINKISPSESFKLSNLQGCSNLEITVIPYDEYGTVGESTKLNIEVGFRAPDRIKKLVTMSNSPNSINVQWNHPQRNLECIDYYVARCDGQKNVTIFTSFMFNNLQPCQRYNIEVCIIMKYDGNSLCTVQHQDTKYATPEVVIEPRLVQSYSANVSFEYKNATCIRSLQVTVNSLKKSFYYPNLPQHYYVDRLQPCSPYKVLVRVNSIMNTLETTLNFTTASVLLNGSLENIVFDKHSSLITWDRHSFGETCIKYYYINYEKMFIKSYYERAELKNLPGCSNFQIVITPVDINDSNGLQNIKNFQSGFKPPVQLKIEHAFSNTPNSISVIWSAPTINPNCVENYAVICDGRIEYSNLTTHTINNLQPCTSYNITVCIIMVHNQTGECNEFSDEVITRSAQPEITIGAIRSTSISARFPFTYKNPNCITKLKIELIDGDSESFHQPNLPEEFYIENLEPCSIYNITVKAFNDYYTDFNLVTNETFTTESVQIEAITNVRFDQNTELISWEKPNIRKECIKYYLIDDGLNANETSQEFYDLSYLPGCSNFTVRIAAVGMDYEIGYWHKENLQTKIKEPDNVKILSAFSVSPNSILMHYAIPQNNQNCIRGYAIVYDDRIEYTKLLTHTINNLEPCSTYSLQICIIMINNRTGPCTVKTENITTNLEFPETTIDTIVSDSTCANISLKYKYVNCINYIEIGLIDKVPTSFDKLNLPEHFQLNQLKPCTLFNLIVKSYINRGTVIYTHSKLFKTNSVEIGPVKDLNFNQNANLLTWTPPDFGAECINQYAIDDGEKTSKTSSTSHSLEYLAGCSNFLIQVTPLGGIGGRGAITELNIITGVKDPESVEIIYADSHNPNSITVIWKSPRTNPNCVKKYAIISDNRMGYTNLTNSTIDNLEACTDYKITVCILMINNNTGLCTKYTRTITTESAVPEIIIYSVISDSTTANASLSYKSSNCIWYLEIGIDNKVLDLYNRTHLPNYLWASHLEPCSEYTMFVKTQHTAGLREPFYTNKTFFTNSSHISKVENIEFDKSSSVITWMPPVYGEKCIRQYFVTSNGVTNVTRSEWFELSHLPGCSIYTIEITPVGNDDLPGDTQIKSVEIEFKPPDSVTNFIAFLNTSTSISMLWNSPNQNPNCVRAFIIKFDNNTVTTNSTEYIIDNLEPCIEYTFHVCIEMMNNQTGMCTKGHKVKTGTAIVSTVQNIRHVNSIIEWNLPNFGAKCIEKYLLTVQDRLEHQIIWKELSSSYHQLNTSVLDSCQYYNVTVTAINVDHEKGAEANLTIKTESSKPEATSAPKLISKTATTLQLVSEYENDRDLCALQKAIFTCRANDESTVNHVKYVPLSPDQRKFSAILSELNSLTKYSCRVRVENQNYSSDDSAASEYETDEQLCKPPTFLIDSVKSTSLCLKWEAPPATHNIRLKGYYLNIFKIGKNYPTPLKCDTSLYNKTFPIKANMSRYEIFDLEPYTKYSLQMAVENTAGIGFYGEPIEIITKPDTPYQVTNFRVHRINLDRTVELKWDLPCEINGEIISIKGTFDLSRPPNISKITYEWELKRSTGLLSLNYYKESKIEPEHFYFITIGIKIKNFEGPLNETSVSFTSPTGIPATYQSNSWGFVTDESSTTNSVKLTVRKNLFISTNGQIRKFTFLISERKCQADPKPNYMFFINEFDKSDLWLSSWYDFDGSKCTGQYRIQDFIYGNTFDQGDSYDFEIGNDTCDKLTRSYVFCNGPLKPGTDYAIIARVYTSVGYADTNPIHFSTRNNFSILLLILLCILTSALLVGFVRTQINFIKQPIDKTDDHSAMPMTDKPDIIPEANADPHIYFLETDADVIIDEFEAINAMDLSDLTAKVARRHKEKNRYANILPYDQNRVYLTPNAYCLTGYINASYVDGFTRSDEYIASQGPTRDTCYDFWSMIIETNCSQIVMLTKLVENGIVKCDQYYPNLNDELQFSDITVANIRELELNSCTRRELKITQGTIERLVVLYHFQKWPDHGCPENELDLIKLIQYIRLEKRSFALDVPIVVHCSAGVGRTGTLIALDILMHQVDNGQHTNVCETVKNLRYQRVKMVQSLVQYQFLYKCVRRYKHRKVSK